LSPSFLPVLGLATYTFIIGTRNCSIPELEAGYVGEFVKKRTEEGVRAWLLALAPRP
jgi:hypothetical protein